MTIELHHPAFRATLHDLHTSAEELARTKLALAREVELLLDAGWSGTPASAYREGWTDWQEGVDQVVRGLTALTDLMEATHRDLQGRDLTSQASLERLAERLLSRLGVLEQRRRAATAAHDNDAAAGTNLSLRRQVR